MRKKHVVSDLCCVHDPLVLEEVQSLAESLGIHVEQAKCDVSKQVPLGASGCPKN